MIQVEAYQTDGYWQSFQLAGHADSGPYGHDLVCSAVSVLSLSVVNNTKRLVGVDLDLEANQEEGGYLKFSQPDSLSDHQFNQVQFLFDFLYWSLLDIEKQYPEYINIKMYQ